MVRLSINRNHFDLLSLFYLYIRKSFTYIRKLRLNNRVGHYNLLRPFYLYISKSNKATNASYIQIF